MPEPVIAVEDLAKTYREGWIRRRRLDVLRGLSFSVGAGEVFGLLGPNGAGKTTFIKILLGIVRASGGRATLLGQPAGSRRSRRQIGYLPENLRIGRHHTALSALDYYGQLSGLPRRVIRQRGEELLHWVGLSARAGDSITKYSKGMLQRLGLAQALLHEPQLVILDEPTDGLDPVGRSQVRNVLLQLKQQGKTVFVNSHILQEVELVCDRVAILDKGQLRYVGPVQDVTRHGGLGAAMGAPTDGGAATELEVVFELQGRSDLIRAAFGNLSGALWDELPGGIVRVTLRLPDQARVDRTLDALRQQGISIIGLTRRRLTLEDAFLAIVETVDS
ncbi:MAG: ABC transporter ATP-binding protein [Pirellulales bacterium]